MRLFQCGYCFRVLSFSNEKWVLKKDLLNVELSQVEVHFVICPICFLKRGEADFFRKEVKNVHNDTGAVPEDKEIP